MERIQQIRHEVRERIENLQEAFRKVDIPGTIRSQVNDIVRPIIQDTASSEAVQNALKRLSDFTANVLTPMIDNYVSHEAADSLSKSVDDLVVTVKKYQGPVKTGTLAKKSTKIMKACVYDAKADSKVKISDVKEPSFKNSTDVLIRVAAVGLSESDNKKMDRHIPLINNMNGKLVGTEFAGTIENLGWLKGDHVHMFPFAIGDKVFGTAEGALGEFISCKPQDIYWAPAGLPYETFAALPKCGTAAYRALKDNGMKEGHVVAVIGASNELGNLVVQIANAMGAAVVVGIASGEHRDTVLSVGASTFIDSSNQDIQEVIDADSVDIVVDTMSLTGNTYEQSFEGKIRAGGKYVALNAKPIDKARKFISDRIGINVQRGGFDALDGNIKREDLALLASWCEEGKINPLIGNVYDFTDDSVREALEGLKGVAGKTVIRVNDLRP